MNLLITGGCGYVGTVLTQALLEDGHNVNVIDTQWFGNHLQVSNNLNIIKNDIRNIEKIDLPKIDSVIHLANIANDPAVDLNPSLSWEVNVLATKQLIDKAIDLGAKQFIYASSGSVYGVKDELNVTEDLSTKPISIYNKTKIIAERVLMSYVDKIKIHNIRPATVCGISPRMRFDVSVNMLTMQALKNKLITVTGGSQTRPNIHIEDMISVYKHFLSNPNLPSGPYNAGFQNISILDLAKMISEEIPSDIIVSESNDPRSYRQNSDKLLGTNFKPQYSIQDAIIEIKKLFNEGSLTNKDEFHTVKWMKKIDLDEIYKKNQ